MSPQTLLTRILDELITYTTSIFHPAVSAGTLRTIGTNIAKQAHSHHKLSVRQLSATLPHAFADAATHLSLWQCKPVRITPEEVIFETDTCPFGSRPLDVPQYCHLTSGFFGGLAVQYFDRAKVEVFKGTGCPPIRCRIHVRVGSLVDSPSTEGEVFTKGTHPSDESIRRPLDINLSQPLSSRELTVLRMIGEGLTAKEIAISLHSSVRTIENSVARISHKLGIRGRARLLKFALQYLNPALPLPKAFRQDSP